MANEIQYKFGTLTLDITNNITINGIEIKESKSIKVTAIPKTEGSIAESAKRLYLTVMVRGDISGSDYDDLRTKIDALKAALQNGLQKFTTDDDRYIMAQLKDFSHSYVTPRTLANWSASFIAHYPFWLAETESVDERTPTSGVGYTITNIGNAPTRVKVEVTAPAGDISDALKIENQTNGMTFQYRGVVVAAEVFEADNRHDSDDLQVLNDGADAIVDFEGDFLELAAGANTIVFTGPAGSVVKITHRNAWY